MTNPVENIFDLKMKIHALIDKLLTVAGRRPEFTEFVQQVPVRVTELKHIIQLIREAKADRIEVIPLLGNKKCYLVAHRGNYQVTIKGPLPLNMTGNYIH